MIERDHPESCRRQRHVDVAPVQIRGAAPAVQQQHRATVSVNNS
jgi:hypothetical protein